MIGSRWIRYGSLFSFLLFMTWMGYRHQVVGGGPSGVPPVDALCPFGGLESLYAYLREGVFLKRTAPSSLILWGVVALMTIGIGRVFCGWICPLGALGEMAGMLGKRLGLSRALQKFEPWGRFVKILILAAVLILTWSFGTLVMRPYDPWVSWAHMSAGWDEISSSPFGFLVLFIFVLGAAMLASRFFCRYLCPLGGALWFLQLMSLTKVRRDEGTCINCGACDRACPMGIAVSKARAVSDGDCISCGECVGACPVRGTLGFSLKGLRVAPLVVGIAGLMVFLGAYGVARYAGFWRTYYGASKEAASDPVEGIFGWMTVEQASKQVGLPVEEFIRAAGLDEGVPRDVALKKIPGVDDEKVKDSVRAYLASAPQDKKSVPDPDSIKGSQTLGEVASIYGLDERRILKAAGWPEDLAESKDVPLRELAKKAGSEVSSIREAVMGLLRQTRK
ncbi:MAG: 4Fe-4S binding protein [Thermanaerothrix sp.]|nr:4Fe-4S binding protein [Thermanaerothrix sp.]